MSAPCPFCGDTRTPTTEQVLKDAEGELFAAVCQCCGTVGPATRTRGSAMVMWDFRGRPTEWHELFARVSPHR